MLSDKAAQGDGRVAGLPDHLRRIRPRRSPPHHRIYSTTAPIASRCATSRSADADCARRDLTVGAMLLRDAAASKLGQSAAATPPPPLPPSLARGNSFVRRARVLRRSAGVRSNAHMPGAARAAAAGEPRRRVSRATTTSHTPSPPRPPTPPPTWTSSSSTTTVRAASEGFLQLGRRRRQKEQREAPCVTSFLFSLHVHATAHCVSSARIPLPLLHWVPPSQPRRRSPLLWDARTA